MVPRTTAFAALTALLAGGGISTPHPTILPVITVHAGDYFFGAPARLAAGLTTFRLLNDGHALHMLGITRLDSAHTLNELLTTLNQNKPQPAWAVDVGGPNAVSPRGASNATLWLTPGHYVFICWVPGRHGRLHALDGMVAPFDVTPSNVPPAAEPASDLIVHLADYHIDLSRPWTRGPHAIEVLSDGPHEHDLTILRLRAAASVAQVMDWLDNPEGVPAPGTALGGTVGFWPGQRAFVTIDVTPGRYLLLCYVPDDSGKAHYRRGMFREYTVR